MSATRLYPPLLPQPLVLLLLFPQGRPTRTMLIPDLREPLPGPLRAFSELPAQLLGAVGLTRVPRTTGLRPCLLLLLRPLLLLQSRPGRTALIPDLRKPMLPPRRALPELLPQRLPAVGLARVTSTARLHTRRLPQPLPLLHLQRRPGRTALIPDFRKPGLTPLLAFPELLPQTRTAVWLTRVTSTTCFDTRRLVQRLHSIWPLSRVHRFRCPIHRPVTGLLRPPCGTFGRRIHRAGTRIGRVHAKAGQPHFIRVQIPEPGLHNTTNSRVPTDSKRLRSIRPFRVIPRPFVNIH